MIPVYRSSTRALAARLARPPRWWWAREAASAVDVALLVVNGLAFVAVLLLLFG